MKSILCLLVILFASIGAYAQAETLTFLQFDSVYNRAMKFWAMDEWKGRPFRKTTLMHDFLENFPQTDYTMKTTIEYRTPTQYSGVYENNLAGKKKKHEWIQLDDKHYSRLDDGEWQEGGPGTPTAFNVKRTTLPDTFDEKSDYRYLGIEKLDGQPMNVYEKTVVSKRFYEAKGIEWISTATTKYWIGATGALLKSDMVRVTRISGKTYRDFVTMFWEWDDTIKIVAPKLSAPLALSKN